MLNATADHFSGDPIFKDDPLGPIHFLAAMQTAGTIVICVLTFWKGDRRTFKTEDSQVLTATAELADALHVTLARALIGTADPQTQSAPPVSCEAPLDYL